MVSALLIFGMNLPSRGQNQDVVLSWGKSWKVSGGQDAADIPWFSGAVYPDPESPLPRYVRLFQGTEADELNVVLENTVYEPVPPDEHLMPEVLSSLRPDPGVNLHTGWSAGQPYTEVSILPFRLAPGGNQAERLVAFTLKVEQLPVKKNLAPEATEAWKAGSVLASGYWYKIKVNSSGIYKITYSKLLELGISNPAGLRIYGNGGAHNPILPGKRLKDDLTEIPFSFEKGDDGVFNTGDYVLVYLQGPGSCIYDAAKGMLLHQLHRSADAAYYFLTSGSGLPGQVKTIPAEAGTATHTVTSYTATAWHEKETYNLIRSGSRWFGERFDIITRLEVPFAFPELAPGATAKVLIGLAGRDASSTSFSISSGINNLGVIPVSAVNIGSTTGNFASYSQGFFQFQPSGGNIPVVLDYNKDGKSSAEAWLDYVDMNVECKLDLNGNQLEFRSLANIGAGQLAEFNLNNADSHTRVWDITDINNPRQLTGLLEGNRFTFRRSSDSIREYIAFDAGADFPAPIFKADDLGPVANQDLHGTGPTDYIIITPPIFLPYAEKLANLHREKDQLRTVVATTTQVYNEFSSGAPDMTAYRDFVKMLYDRAGAEGDKPRYLLLFGDGTFDNRTIDPGNANFILTYQSDNSLTQNASYVTDDYFGWLDNNESDYSGALDIGIGRFPVHSVLQADSVVGKVRRYMDPSKRGSWKNLISFIGDDEDSGTHTEQADELATDIETNYPGFVVEKIYLDAYQQQTSPSGQSYPDVNKAIAERVRKGALIINYTGHGNENGLAHERILLTNDIKAWTNEDLLPLFVTATCEFSRFDDVSIEAQRYSNKTSAGEEILLNTQGGGIGLLTTTRLVYSLPNFYLNEKFYAYVFSRDSNGKRLRLGDVLRLTKVSSGSGINKLNFTLLGDPAVELDYPEQFIITDSLNGVPLGDNNDTLKAFSNVRISGHFEDINGNQLNDFSGEVFPVLFDKALELKTLDNDGEGPVTYSTYNSVLFRGVASVEKGLFNFSFIVPRDINYQVGEGKLVLYGLGKNGHAQGASKLLKIGSINSLAIPDDKGPDIALYMNDSTFISGGITSPDPVLKAWLYDQGGVNITSSGIGHEIIAILDDETRFVLNDYYQSATNDYTRGQVSYPLSGLSEGMHTIRFKVWDINNNSSEAELSFRVSEKGILQIENLKNFPNPFSQQTTIEFNHNMAGEDMEVNLTIYSLTGQPVFSRTVQMTTEGFSSEPMIWDGRDGNGARVREGIYLYRIRVNGEDGQMAGKSGKLVILKE
ncbi:MAG: type IX secretion system sortase PorU [Bacteroidales bacterium]